MYSPFTIITKFCVNSKQKLLSMARKLSNSKRKKDTAKLVVKKQDRVKYSESSESEGSEINSDVDKLKRQKKKRKFKDDRKSKQNQKSINESEDELTDSERSVESNNKNKRQKQTKSQHHQKSKKESEIDELTDSERSAESNTKINSSDTSEESEADLAEKKFKKKLINKGKQDKKKALKIGKEKKNLDKCTQKRVSGPVKYYSSESEDSETSESKDSESSFSDKKEEKHNKFKAKNKSVVCKQCGTSFNTYLLLAYHMRSAHKKPFYKCALCRTTFKSYYDYKDHMKSFHPELKLYPCDYPGCLKSFSTIKRIRNHQSEHYPFSCRFCKKPYQRKRDMRLHVEEVHM